MTSVITYVCGNTFQELPHSSSCLEPESCLQTKRWMKKFSPLFYGFKTHRRFHCVQDHMLQNLPMSIFYFCLRGACRKFLLATMIEWMTCPCIYSHQQRINLYFFCRIPLKDSDFTNNKSGSAGWVLCYATWHSSKVKFQSFFHETGCINTGCNCNVSETVSSQLSGPDIIICTGQTILLCYTASNP